MPLLDLGVYVAFETFMAFMNEPGVLEITGIPTLGNAPIPGTATYKEIVRLNSDNSAAMTIQLQHINMSTQVVDGRSSPTILLEAETNINNYGNAASLGIKVFRGDNYGVITNIFNNHTSFNSYNDNKLSSSLVYTPDEGGAIGVGLVNTAHDLQLFPIKQQQQAGDVVPKYQWQIVNGKMINEIFNGKETYIYNVYWNSRNVGGGSTPSNCGICVIRVKGKQWQRQPTTTTSSSGRNGSARLSSVQKSKRLTRTASLEKALIETKMEASQHSRRTTRSARPLERQARVLEFLP